MMSWMWPIQCLIGLCATVSLGKSTGNWVNSSGCIYIYTCEEAAQHTLLTRCPCAYPQSLEHSAVTPCAPVLWEGTWTAFIQVLCMHSSLISCSVCVVMTYKFSFWVPFSLFCIVHLHKHPLLFQYIQIQPPFETRPLLKNSQLTPGL